MTPAACPPATFTAGGGKAFDDRCCRSPRIKATLALLAGSVVAKVIPLPAPEVSVNIRKGVAVNDAPSTIAG